MAAAVLAVSLALVGWCVVGWTLRQAADDLRLRSAVYGLSLVSRLAGWTGSAEGAYARGLGDYMGASGLLYACGIEDGQTVFEIGSGSGACVGAAPGVAERRLADGRRAMQVSLPYMRAVTGPGPRIAEGFVVLGIDAAELDRAAMSAISLAAGSWLLALAAFFVGASRRERRPLAAAPQDEDTNCSSTLCVGPLMLDVNAARLSAGGRSVRLTPKQLDVLRLLFSQPGRAFSDSEILDAAWHDSTYADSRDVKQYVYLIRKRLDSAGLPAGAIVSNVPGVGYRIDVEAVSIAVESDVEAPSIDESSPRREDPRAM